MKIKYNNEIISGAVFAILAVVLWLLIPSQVDTMETASINAQTFPRIAIGGLFLCSAGLLLQGIFSIPKKEVVLSRETFQSPNGRKELKSVVYALMLIAYAVVLTLFGFLIATALLVVAIELFYGARKWYYYAIPLAMVGIVYYVFSVVLHVSLP